MAFHEAVTQLSSNSYLLEVYERYVPLLRSFMKLDELLYDTLEDVALDHEPMLEAIEAGDRDLAAARFREHAEKARDVLVAHVDSLPART